MAPPIKPAIARTINSSTRLYPSVSATRFMIHPPLRPGGDERSDVNALLVRPLSRRKGEGYGDGHPPGIRGRTGHDSDPPVEVREVSRDGAFIRKVGRGVVCICTRSKGVGPFLVQDSLDLFQPVLGEHGRRR